MTNDEWAKGFRATALAYSSFVISEEAPNVTLNRHSARWKMTENDPPLEIFALTISQLLPKEAFQYLLQDR